MKKLIVLFLVINSTISYGQDSVLLHLNYNKGDKFLMKTSQAMNSSDRVMSNDTEMTMEVIDNKDGVFTSEMKIDKMVMNMMQGGMQMSYDSSNKGELDQMGQMMKSQIDPMLKVVITTKTNEFGKVLETKVEPSIPGVEELKNQSSIPYPKTAVKVGDTWTDNSEAQGMKSAIEYKITGITADKVTMTATGTISGVATGTMTGTFEIDRKSGLPLKSSIKNDMKIQGQDMKTEAKITMKRL